MENNRDNGYFIATKISAQDSYIIKKIIIKGNTIFNSETIENVLNFKSEGEIKKEEIDSCLKNISYFYAKEGYTLARIPFYFLDKSGTIIITIDEGIIEDIVITGNEKIKTETIKAFLGMQPKSVFNEDLLKLKIKKLYNTGLYEKIKYSLQPGIEKEQEHIILIEIEEKKFRYMDVSINYKSLLGIIPFLSYTDRKFMKINSTLGMSIQLGFWEKINMQKYSILYKIRNIDFILSYIKGINIRENIIYNTESKQFKSALKLWSGKFQKIEFIFDFNYINFLDKSKLLNYSIRDKARYNLFILWNYSDEMEKIDEFEFNNYQIRLGSGLVNSKLESYIKQYFKLNYFHSININSKFFGIWGNVSFDEEYPIGGFSNRGYKDSSYWAKLKFDNSVDYEIFFFFRKLIAIIFLDTTIYSSDYNKFQFLKSVGIGFRLKSFGVQAIIYYGIPIEKHIKNNQILIAVRKILY